MTHWFPFAFLSRDIALLYFFSQKTAFNIFILKTLFWLLLSIFILKTTHSDVWQMSWIASVSMTNTALSVRMSKDS